MNFVVDRCERAYCRDAKHSSVSDGQVGIRSEQIFERHSGDSLLHAPRCFMLTWWPEHCALIRWHLVGYVWWSVPHTGRPLDSSHSPPLAAHSKICCKRDEEVMNHNADMVSTAFQRIVTMTFERIMGSNSL